MFTNADMYYCYSLIQIIYKIFTNLLFTLSLNYFQNFIMRSD